VIDHPVGRGDPSVLSNPYEDNLGLWSNDYMTRQEVIENADLQNLGQGIIAPTNSDIPGTPAGPDVGVFTIENSYLANVTNIISSPVNSTNGDDLAQIQVVVNNDVFAQPNVNRTFLNIDMENSPGAAEGLAFLQVAYVYNYNGISGDNFAVYPTRVTTYGTNTMPLINGYVAAIPSGAPDATIVGSPSVAPASLNGSLPPKSASGVAVRGSQSATRSVVAGPLALSTTVRRNSVAQAVLPTNPGRIGLLGESEG
jgi:hypothetical protein